MNGEPLERSDIPVVILCGGRARGCARRATGFPSLWSRSGDSPILWHIMKIYSHHGFHRFVLCLGYKGWLIKEYFLSYRARLRLHDPPGESASRSSTTGWRRGLGDHLRRDRPVLGHGRSARLVRDYIDTPPSCSRTATASANVDIAALLAFPRADGRVGTVTGVRPTSRYGEIQVDGDRVLEFDEKPTIAEGRVSGGFFVFQREFLGYLDDDPDLLVEQAAAEPRPRRQLSVFRHEGFWMGMDTYREFTALNTMWESGHPPWKVWD